MVFTNVTTATVRPTPLLMARRFSEPSGESAAQKMGLRSVLVSVPGGEGRWARYVPESTMRQQRHFVVIEGRMPDGLAGR